MSPQQIQAIAPVETIVAELKAGRMVILVDEEDRENEGDLVMAAEHVTPEAINFMAKHGRGLICLTLTEARCRHLGLSQMARNNGTQFGTVHRVHRGGRGRDHRHFGGRSGAYHPYGRGADGGGGRHRPAGPRISDYCA